MESRKSQTAEPLRMHMQMCIQREAKTGKHTQQMWQVFTHHFLWEVLVVEESWGEVG